MIKYVICKLHFHFLIKILNKLDQLKYFNAFIRVHLIGLNSHKMKAYFIDKCLFER